MNFLLPNEEQVAIGEGVASFLAGHLPLERFRNECGAGDAQSWPGLAELGLFSIGLPEDQGGLGLSLMDNALACREAGRVLVSPALIGTLFGAHVAAANNEAALLESLLSGQRQVGMALAVGEGRLNVIDGSGLCLLVERDQLQLISYQSSDAQMQVSMDESICLQAINRESLQTKVYESTALVQQVYVLVAAMLCGVLEQTCAMAADYARTREQFGRPIGAFQGIKHRCADAALGAELAWSQTLSAVQALMAERSDAQFHALSAKLLAGEEALKACRANIQIHGGMGFTDEVDAHRLLKRAHVLHQLLGDPRQLKTQLLKLDLES